MYLARAVHKERALRRRDQLDSAWSKAGQNLLILHVLAAVFGIALCGLGLVFPAMTSISRIISSVEAVFCIFLRVAVAKRGITVLYVGACGSSVLQDPKQLVARVLQTPPPTFLFYTHICTHARTHISIYLNIYIQDLFLP